MAVWWLFWSNVIAQICYTTLPKETSTVSVIIGRCWSKCQWHCSMSHDHFLLYIFEDTALISQWKRDKPKTYFCGFALLLVRTWVCFLEGWEVFQEQDQVCFSVLFNLTSVCLLYMLWFVSESEKCWYLTYSNHGYKSRYMFWCGFVY